MDAIKYFKQMVEKNRLAIADDFHFSTAPTMGAMADMLYEERDHVGHVVCIDTSTSSISQQQGGGYFERKQYTLHIMRRFEPDDEKDRIKQRDKCRLLKQQILARMVKDALKYEQDDLTYFDMQNVLCQEMSDFMLNGLCGLWFVFQLDEPIDLKESAANWTS